jgi:hypothetical protein
MTEGLRDLLRLVRDERQPRLSFSIEALQAVSDGLIRQDVHGVFSITPAGLAALAAHEQGSGKEA